MAVITIPNTATEQVTENLNLSDSGEITSARSFKDTYANLKTWVEGLAAGDTLGGCVLKSASLSRTNANLGIATLNLSKDDTTGDVQIALDETWTLKAVRNDMSILGYCGDSASNPNRADVEAWLKEPDGTIAAEFKYTKSDQSQKTLSQASQDLAEKFLKGFESVMRFYPMLTKRRTYSNMPQTVMENLAHINTPTVSGVALAKKVSKPGNLNSIISGHSWLKCQDDLEKTADGNFVRVESWIGAKNGEQSWDTNFYGDGNARWPIPYQA